ncbi:FBD-associated F-box protein At1g66310-like [Pistacia vera]|uniref:FBD-associated F-box protein At1g66310-like n=1 Tax=Pistacia vera TaxID=55513 RepID=UPI001263233E|nr:FBD-associated F-box protein At1g66310-like [Pistacia vera]
MRPRKKLESSMVKETIISDLPEHIIHNVLSLLSTKDAARTTVLSKRFRLAWTSFPIIDLDFTEFRNNIAIDQFLDFVRDSLQRRAPNICVEKFRLLVVLRSMEADNRIDGAISYAIEHKVKELDLHLLHTNNFNDLYYKLPSVLFSVDSVKVLKLKGFNLETLDLEKFPLIEELSLISCAGLNNLRVSNGQLKILEVKSCGGLLQIDISKSNLRSFSFTGKHSGGGEYENCQINPADCHSLTNLAIRGAPKITSEWFDNYVSKLTLLENLILSECKRLKKIYIPNPEVKVVEIKRCAVLGKIEIVAQNVQSFVYFGQSRPCQIKITACRLLRNLQLYGANVEARWIEERLSQLPLLESLRLCYCDMLRTLEVSHEQLKSFQLINCSILEKAVIYAPNLIYFRYEGKVLKSPLSVDSPHLEAELTVDSGRYITSSDEWYNKLRNFLGYFDHCKLLILNCIPRRNLYPTFLIFPEDLRDTLLPPLFDVKHLKVKIEAQLKDIISLVDGLLWLSPLLETMSIIDSGSGGGESSLKFQYAKSSVMEEMDLTCCHSRIIKCWRHHLKKVSMENFSESDRMRLMDYFGRKAMRLETIET